MLTSPSDMPSLHSIRDFYQLTDRGATSGQPTLEQCRWIADAGYQAVINLADTSDVPAGEPETWLALGLSYTHIPVAWQQPMLGDALQVFDAVRKHDRENLYVHCVANRRVSAFMYVYRVTQLGMPEPEARRDLNQLWEPNPIWQRWIDEVMHHFNRAGG